MVTTRKSRLDANRSSCEAAVIKERIPKLIYVKYE